MPYYTRDDEAVDDFDEYDPTPYGGGFDLFLTYGRPISPCEETCYPHSAGNDDDFDYERPQFDSYAEPSAYGDEALQAEYSSYSRPNRRPGIEIGGGAYGARPEPAYGFQPGGSEYGRKPERYGEEQGYGRRPETESYGSEGYGSGYGQKPEGYGGGEDYGRRPEAESYGSGGYRRQSEYESQEGEYGRKQSYGEEQGSGYGYGGRSERPEYGRDEYERPSYGDDPPRRPSYGRSEEEDYRKPSYERRDDDDERRYGYSEGRKKYGGDSDEEEKHSRRHRRNYDDE